MQARSGPTRRAMIAGLGSVALPTTWLALPAQAAAPLARRQPPGFYRMMLGDFEVTALLDGTMELPVTRILNGIQAGDVETLFADASLRSPLAAGRFLPFEGSVPLAPGLRSRSAGGHTPGHCVYEVESKGYKLMVLGDLMHVAAVQFQRPRTGIQFDSNSQAAGEQRVALYEQAAAQQSILAISHVSFPGLGRLRQQGSVYQWQPVNYTVIR